MNEEYLNRYSRQLKILGEAGQEKLRNSKVGVAGVGGLGSTVTMLLAAAGVGKLVLVDDGEVELSNLNRQILYTENDLGKVKVEVASKRLRALNSGIEVIPVKASLHSKEAQEVLKGVDVLVDCLDNWKSRIVLDYPGGTPYHLSTPAYRNFMDSQQQLFPALHPASNAY